LLTNTDIVEILLAFSRAGINTIPLVVAHKSKWQITAWWSLCKHNIVFKAHSINQQRHAVSSVLPVRRMGHMWT